jgi:hypothetical protein
VLSPENFSRNHGTFNLPSISANKNQTLRASTRLSQAKTNPVSPAITNPSSPLA